VDLGLPFTCLHDTEPPNGPIEHLGFSYSAPMLHAKMMEVGGRKTYPARLFLAFGLGLGEAWAVGCWAVGCWAWALGLLLILANPNLHPH